MDEKRITLKPFFTYYGGKYRVAPHYPKPEHSMIVEPFAGSAGYSLRYPDKEVRLYDVDDHICGVWDYLINTKAREILRLPVGFSHIDDVKATTEAKYLMGFWLNKGSASPCKSPSAWMRKGTHTTSFWGETIRARIASQVEHIRHWSITQSGFVTVPYYEATYFVDPPYQNPVGRHYRHGFTDFSTLAEWCRSRDGQVIVCEQEGADWLPFQPFRVIKANESKTGKKTSNEVMWVNDDVDSNSRFRVA